MNDTTWADTLQAAITVCDKEGHIIYMNQASQLLFEKDGGKALIGKSLFDCHSPASVDQIHKMLADGTSNSYTIKKQGKKKMVLQTPFIQDGLTAGLVEISFEIPEVMLHHNRD